MKPLCRDGTMTLAFVRPDHAKDSADFRLEKDGRLRWQLGDGRSVGVALSVEFVGAVVAIAGSVARADRSRNTVRRHWRGRH